jgi:outer membrane protein assembly factor BamB
VGGRLYTLAERAGRQEAVCLEASSGRAIFRRDLEEGFPDRQGGDGPRATPAVGEGLVFALGARGTLAALDAESGEPRWRIGLLEKLGARNLTWGLTGSPLLESGRLIVQIGESDHPVVALKPATGEVLWRSGAGGLAGLAGYSTPYAITHAGRRQVVVFLGKGVVGLDPESGKTLWSYAWETSYDANAAAPIYQDGRLFISSGYNRGCALLELPQAEGGRPGEAWMNLVLKNKFSSSVLHQGYLYGFDENRLKCVEFRSGKESWRQGGLGHGTVLIADGQLIILGDQGDLALARATPQGYQETARAPGVLRNLPAWTVPVLHGGVLFLRDLREAVALRISGD